jgi:hypothetical protein
MPVAFRTFAATKILMKVSGKSIIALFVITITLIACGKKQKELTPQQIEAKADSILQTKIGKMRKDAKEDLEKRLSIEVKPKVDSILHRSGGIQAPPVLQEDTVNAATDTLHP